MDTKSQKMQKLIRYYKRETGKTEVNMRDVAQFAIARGWNAPRPKSPIELLAQEFSSAAREEIKIDQVTGHPYRANHAYKQRMGNDQLTLWVDIDEVSRIPMRKSLINRREQMVGDALQLTLDLNHWNRINPKEEPILVPLDFADDVAERLAVMGTSAYDQAA